MRHQRDTVLIVLALLATAPAAAQSAEDVGRTAKDIVTSPLRDVNIVREEIPPLLAESSKDPYSLKGLRTCSQLTKEIARLDEVLGPDVDKVRPKEGQSVGEAALDLTEGLATGLIPGRGIIRRVSGAEAHDRRVRAAVLAGNLRRAYLKGYAKARDCKL